ncbi:MAG: hypothetical protein JXB60_05550 [Candidatus Cloacimonetes bacterium]|nr:hypothetical protein [Candidatus Cloacimonadota bacterium]
MRKLTATFLIILLTLSFSVSGEEMIRLKDQIQRRTNFCSSSNLKKGIYIKDEKMSRKNNAIISRFNSSSCRYSAFSFRSRRLANQNMNLRVNINKRK